MRFTHIFQKTKSFAATSLIFVVLVVLKPTSVFAQDTYNWIQAGDGVFSILNNWSPFGVPGINDLAVYDLDEEITTFLLEDHAVDVVRLNGSADITFESSGFTNGDRELSVRFVHLTGNSQLQLETGSPNQRMLLNSDNINNLSRMAVQNGSKMLVNTSDIGLSPFSGTVVVDGTTTTGVPSSWETNELTVNLGGVTVSNGGTMVAPNVLVRAGSITVSSPSTLFTSIDEIDLGTTGPSSFVLTSGATVDANDLNIAVSSFAFMNVVGNSANEISTLTSTGNVVVGGRLTQSGDDGSLLLDAYSLTEIDGILKIWEEGDVSLHENAKLVVDTIENDLGGEFEFFGGELQVNQFLGNLDNQGGAFVPGGSGFASVLIFGDYSGSPGASLKVDIAGTSPGFSQDFVNVSGQILLDGVLEVSVINGFTPESTDTFTIIASDALFGNLDNAFNGQRIDTSDGSGSFLVNYGIGSSFDEDRVVLSDYQPNQILGDVNGDGVVDLLDVAPFVEAITNSDFVTAADINQDGIVDLLDVTPFVELLVS